MVRVVSMRERGENPCSGGDITGSAEAIENQKLRAERDAECGGIKTSDKHKSDKIKTKIKAEEIKLKREQKARNGCVEWTEWTDSSAGCHSANSITVTYYLLAALPAALAAACISCVS